MEDAVTRYTNLGYLYLGQLTANSKEWPIEMENCIHRLKRVWEDEKLHLSKCSICKILILGKN